MKKNIIYLGIFIAISTIALAVIDGTMCVWQGTCGIEKIPPKGLLQWWTEVLWWWIIVPIILGLVTVSGLIGFLLGSKLKLSSKDVWGLILVGLTPIIFMISGLFDLISGTTIASLRGEGPLGWANWPDWWVTVYLPFPAILARLADRVYPLPIDVVIGSITGILLLFGLWFHFYKYVKS